MKRLILFFILQILFVSGIVRVALSQTPTTTDSIYTDEAIDTIFLAPDTIKTRRVVTVYVDEETPPPASRDKENKRISIFIGPAVGASLTRMLSLYNTTHLVPVAGFHTTITRQNMFADCGIFFSGKETASLSFSRQYISTRSRIDTVVVVLDEFVQIINNQVVKFQVTKKKTVTISDTSRIDSTFTARNSYSYATLPLVVGWCGEWQTVMVGAGIGCQLRLATGDRSNVLIGNDTSWIPAREQSKNVLIDMSCQAFTRYRVTRTLWLNLTAGASYPLASHYTATRMLRPALSTMMGIEFRPAGKKKSRKH
jgi:hypothetical protein